MIIKEWKNKKVIVGNEEKEKMRKMSLITYILSLHLVVLCCEVMSLLLQMSHLIDVSGEIVCRGEGKKMREGI